MFISPVPAPSASARAWSKPEPSSVTSRRQRPPSSRSRTVTRAAPECLAAFWTASMQQK